MVLDQSVCLKSCQRKRCANFFQIFPPKVLVYIGKMFVNTFSNNLIEIQLINSNSRKIDCNKTIKRSLLVILALFNIIKKTHYTYTVLNVS